MWVLFCKLFPSLRLDWSLLQFCALLVAPWPLPRDITVLVTSQTCHPSVGPAIHLLWLLLPLASWLLVSITSYGSRGIYQLSCPCRPCSNNLIRVCLVRGAWVGPFNTCKMTQSSQIGIYFFLLRQFLHNPDTFPQFLKPIQVVPSRVASCRFSNKSSPLN